MDKLEFTVSVDFTRTRMYGRIARKFILKNMVHHILDRLERMTEHNKISMLPILDINNVAYGNIKIHKEEHLPRLLGERETLRVKMQQLDKEIIAMTPPRKISKIEKSHTPLHILDDRGNLDVTKPKHGEKITLKNGNVQEVIHIYTDFFFGVFLVKDNLGNNYVVAEDNIDGTWFETETNI